jgi:protein O-mannosyl-transferase
VRRKPQNDVRGHLPCPRRRHLFLIGLAAIVLFANTIPNALVSDDAELIAKNAATHDPFAIGKIIGGRYWGGIIENDTLYRPLTIWTMALNNGLNRLFGLPGAAPAAYHIVNVLLHAGAACMLYVLVSGIGLAPGAALVSSLAFAALPIHTEAVASIVGRAEILAASLGMLFLLLHRRRRMWLAGGSLLLAVLSKESALAFVAVALWMDVCFGASQGGAPSGGGSAKDGPAQHGSTRRASEEAARVRPGALIPYAVYAGVALVWFLARSAVIGGTRLVIMKIDNPLIDLSFLERILAAAAIQLRYLRLEVLPIGFSSDYSFNQIPIRGAAMLLSAALSIGIAAGAGVLAWRLRRRPAIVPFAAGGYALLFLPAGNFLFPVGTIMGERLAYAPSLFFCALAGFAIWMLRERWQGRKNARASVVFAFTAILLTYGAVDVARNRTWHDYGSFVRAQVASAPRSAKARYNAGLIAQQDRRFDLAAAEYRRAIEIHPEYVQALNNLGIVCRAQGKDDEAIRLYRRAIEILPTHPQSHFNLGQAYHLKGDLESAAAEYRTAISLNPSYVQALTNLAAIYMGNGHLDTAEPLLERAVQLDPSYAPARTNLERLRSARGR